MLDPVRAKVIKITKENIEYFKRYYNDMTGTIMPSPNYKIGDYAIPPPHLPPGPTGPMGPTGPIGPMGPTGPAGYYNNLDDMDDIYEEDLDDELEEMELCSYDPDDDFDEIKYGNTWRGKLDNLSSTFKDNYDDEEGDTSLELLSKQISQLEDYIESCLPEGDDKYDLQILSKYAFGWE